MKPLRPAPIAALIASLSLSACAMLQPPPGPKPASPDPLEVVEIPLDRHGIEVIDTASDKPGAQETKTNVLLSPAAETTPIPDYLAVPTGPITSLPSPPTSADATPDPDPEPISEDDAPSAPERVPMWHAKRGEDLHDTMARWSKRADWEISYKTRYRWPIEANAQFRAPFLEAVAQFAEAFGHVSPTPEMTAYQRNKVIVIRDSASDQY